MGDSRCPAQASIRLVRPEPEDPPGPCPPRPASVRGRPAMLLSLLVLLLLLQPLHPSGPPDLWRCFRHLKPSVHRDGDLLLAAFSPLYYVNRKAPVARLAFLLRPHAEEVPHR